MLALLLACAPPPSAAPDTRRPSRDDTAAPEDTNTPYDSVPDGPPTPQDIVRVDVRLDLSTRVGRATLQVVPPSDSDLMVFDVTGLQVTAVTRDGWAITPEVENGRLSVRSSLALAEVVVDYVFPERGRYAFDGWMSELGVSFVWPTFCGNLYPCDPSMSDGVRFGLEVVGVAPGETAIYTTDSVSDAPSYMPAVAVGDYRALELGSTPAGTRLRAWYLPGDQAEATARAGTAHLVEAWDFYERTYGPYPFGADAGAVSVDWGADSWGGMEHHPYYHVGQFDFGTEEVHAHEAAHAWYGDGVRLACWEDFVLSEGTVTYMAARAMEEVGGPDLWAYCVDDFLVHICAGRKVNPVILPEGCNQIDLLEDDIWSLATYMKGACFYEEVGDTIGPEALDAVLAEFYQAHVGEAAEMDDMLELLDARTDPADHAAIDAAATAWLRTAECPADFVERCRAHQAR